MTPRNRLFILAPLLFLPALLLVLLIFVCDRIVERSAAGLHSSTLEALPSRKVALVLGCAEILPNGRTNRYFTERINAAAALYDSGKCRFLLVSGDNGRTDYDEPSAMASALVARGVPPSSIVQDYAGFRTLDSVVRAKEVFGEEEILVVSQRFHNERAVYIARHRGISVHGWNAADVTSLGGTRTRVREKLARVKTVLDVKLLRTAPRFLGPKIRIG